MAELYDKGNGWAKQQLLPYLRPAEAWATKHVDQRNHAADEHLAAAEAARTAPARRLELRDYMAGSKIVRDSLVTSLDAIMKGDEAAYQSQKADYWWVFAAINLLALILHIVSTGQVITLRIDRNGPVLDEELTIPTALRLRLVGYYRRNIGKLMPKPISDEQAVIYHQYVASTLPSMPPLEPSTAISPTAVGGSSTHSPPTAK